MGYEERQGRRLQFDRHKRQQELTAQALAIGGLNAQTAPSMDRFGVPLKVGDKVLYDPDITLLFQVMEIKPVMDPRAPQGTQQIVLQTMTSMGAQGGMPILNLVVVGELTPEAPTEGEHPEDPVTLEPIAPAEPPTELSRIIVP